MPLLRGFFYLTFFLFIGESLRFVLGWPISGGVAGMLLLALWLTVRGGVSEDLAGASQALISVLILLIMPGTVGVFFLGERFSGQWAIVGGALVLGTALSVLTTFLLIKWFAREAEDKARG